MVKLYKKHLTLPSCVVTPKKPQTQNFSQTTRLCASSEGLNYLYRLASYSRLCASENSQHCGYAGLEGTLRYNLFHFIIF